MSITDISARNTAEVVRMALEQAEQYLSPSGSCSSRLYVAIRAADATRAWYAYPSPAAHARLVQRLDDVKTVESTGVMLENLPVGGLMQRGLSLAIHVAQAALAGAEPSVEFVLDEARNVVRLAAREA